MKVKIQIEKIHCARTTMEIGKDEIFYGLLVSAGKMNNGVFETNGNPIVFSKVSEIRKVKKDDGWRPKENNFVIEVGNADMVTATIVLYEADDKDIYEALKVKFNEVLQPDKFSWATIFEAAKDMILKDINENGEIDAEDLLSVISKKPELTPLILSTFLFKVAKESFKYFKQDDFLGSVTDGFNLTSEGFNLPREYKFRKHRGKYNLSLKVEKNA